jgi:putative aldouronate transport system substrate-binding protein
MKKRLLALLICTCMLFTACSKSTTEPKKDTTDNNAVKEEQTTVDKEDSTDQEVTADSPAAQVIAERKAKAEKDGEYQKVVFAFFAWTGAPAGLERINNLINERTRELLGLEVELMVMDFASYAQNVRLMISSGEQLDLFNSTSIGYTTAVNDGFCYDLEKDGLIQTYGSDIFNYLDQVYVDACRINGTLYGITGMRDLAMSPFSIVIGEEYLDGIGFDYDSMYKDPNDKDFINTDLATIEDIFARLHEKYPDKTVFASSPNLIGQGTKVDMVGGDTFGVLLDPANSLKVENLFTSDIFMEMSSMAYRWNQLGYISKDALTDDTSISSRIKAGSAMAMLTQAKPGYKVQISAECGRPMVVFHLAEDILKSSSVNGILWHINEQSEDPVAAMQVFNAFYSDEILSNLLVWGEEGKDYVVMDDGHITYPEGVDANNSEYNHTMNWLLPNQYIAHVWEGNSLDLGQQTTNFNNNAAKSKALGFMFDNSEYAAQLTALTNVWKEYEKQFLCGFVDPEKTLPELDKRLKAAGLEEYIAAKQKQLDEWAAANGVK